MWHFIPTNHTNFCRYQLGALKFNSIVTLTSIDSTGKWLTTTMTVLPSDSNSKQQVPRLLTSVQSGYKSRVLMTPSSGFTICYNSSENPGKYFTFYYYKGYRWIARLRGPQTKVQKGAKWWSFCTTPPAHGCMYKPDILQSLHLGFLWGFHLCRHDWLNHWTLVITSIPSPFFLLWRSGGGWGGLRVPNL